VFCTAEKSGYIPPATPLVLWVFAPKAERSEERFDRSEVFWPDVVVEALLW